MLASAAVGTVEYRSMSEAVRAANPMVDYVEGHAVDVDVEKKVVKVELESLLDDVREGKPPVINLSYDRLVVAVGCKVADDMVPGAKEHALRLKSCDDARRLRTAVGECLEYASRPDVAARADLSEEESLKRQKERRSRATFAIVGGGPTGAELAGELMDFLNDVRRSRVGAYARLKDDVKIMLLHGGSDLVPQFDKSLRHRALESLRKEGVDVRLQTRVKEVGDGFVKIAKKGDEGNVETVKVGVTVWAAGTAPVDFVQTLLTKLPQEAAGKGGRVNVDSWLRCPMPSKDLLGSILVLGDAASFEDQKSDFDFLPQTAQVAGQQGAYAARLIGRGYDLTQTPPAISPNDDSPLSKWLRFRRSDVAPKFSFFNLGQLAYVGGGKALSEIQIGNIPILKYAGSASYVLWRSVYLVKQVATRNRVLVTFDWFKSTVFGRDVTRL
uniref:FAD/NAD(P)-binding domain-containing protein n=1 Tax=Lotharella oceanica TaxID=641309 RepID=A0A7S2TVZ9_9EUKA|mmetsp:Transcript_32447/g.60351  ORF Transcript_32447/g.60351 Transcript_32447/m.60351 type:complete len:442 (+) Transcript_32447:577-1902(+)